VALYDGQYGPYVKHDGVSASIPRGSDPLKVTLAEAVELLAAKKGRGGTKVIRRKKKVARRG
jgi:DNA topoisomerase-1